MDGAWKSPRMPPGWACAQPTNGCDASGKRPWKACWIAPPDPTAARMQPPSNRSWRWSGCGVPGAPTARSRRHCPSPPTRSRGCCIALDCTDWPSWGLLDRSSATSTTGRATCCIRISRNWTASGDPATGSRVTGDRHKSSNGAGWEYVHLAIDDHCRVAFATIEPDERGTSACRMLLKAVHYYRTLGVSFVRVMTGNGPCCKSAASAVSCAGLACATCAHGPTHRGPMAKPNDWSRPHRANGPTHVPTAAPDNAHPQCRTGCTTPTAAGPASPGWQTPVIRIQLRMNNVPGLHS